MITKYNEGAVPSGKGGGPSWLQIKIQYIILLDHFHQASFDWTE